ncbi:MAG TPA: hypothetical protein VF311_03930 [Terriglobales bacterium]
MKKELSRLERDTAAYFERMTEEEAREERHLEVVLAASAFSIDIDELDVA